MYPNPSIPPTDGQTPEPPAGPLIRTMSKDIESLGEKFKREEAAFQSLEYEPPSEMPLGMTPPPPPVSDETSPGVGFSIESSITGRSPIEIPVPPAEAMPSPTQQLPSAPTEGIPPPPPPPFSTIPGTAETIISEKALTEFAPPQPPKKDVKKLALIAGMAGLGIIFGLAGWFLYPKIFPAQTPLPTPVIIIPTPVVQTPTPSPTPIVFFMKMPEKTTILDITAQTKTELIAALKQEMEQKEKVGVLKIIDLRQNGIAMTFSQFANLIGFNFPPELTNLILPEFKLFINSHAQEGNQLGMILNLSDGTAAQPYLTIWENTMANDLIDLFLGENIGEPTVFKDATYRGVSKRYLSFSKPPFSLDYGLYYNFLIITTSRFSFANAVDHLLGE